MKPRSTTVRVPAAVGRSPNVLPALLLAAFALGATSAQAFNSGSTGADGALTPAVNTTVPLPASGVLNYTSINIPAGVTVTFTKNALNTPVQLLVSGDATINGTIDVRGGDGAESGTAGDGTLANDGIPGAGGPGGYSGGRGGQPDPAQSPTIVRGGAGLGPGGGRGGVEGNAGCALQNANSAYFPAYGFGASFAYAGGDGYALQQCSSTNPYRPQAYGSPQLQPLVGGSGGGGGAGGTNYAGAGGGGGGGAILIAVSGTFTLVSPGSVIADGGQAGGSNGTGLGGYGAGGSGGAIRIVASTIAGTGLLYARGGCMHNTTGTGQVNCGSQNTTNTALSGSDGRIRLEADKVTFTGTSSPTYTASTPGPIALSSPPGLSIATVAGTAVPANPTGVGDVTLPSNVANPVTVTFATVNIPTGNTVKLRVVPAYGSSTEVISPAITGSTASGTASVQVTLPQGPSTLQAIAGYTITIAMGEALAPYAQNETVERVEIVASLGSTSFARLITRSGRQFDVPVSVLQSLGRAG